MSQDEHLLAFAVAKGGDLANEVWKDCGNTENPIAMAVTLGQATGIVLAKLRDAAGPEILPDFLVALVAMIAQAGQLQDSGISLVIVEKK